MDLPEYLVAHGVTGALGRFRATDLLCLSRGDRVVVRSGRGVEIGEVIRHATPRHARLLADLPAGVLLRPASADDEALAGRLAGRSGVLLARAGALAGELDLPVGLIDAEVLLDAEHAVLYHVRWGEADLRDLVRPLSQDFNLSVTLADLTAVHETHGCGSCGEGGCGTGGCATGCNSCGSVGAEELQAYFAGLREQMERAAQRRVPLL